MSTSKLYEHVSTVQRRIAQLAREDRSRALTSLNRYLDLRWLQVAYLQTRKGGAPGVDGIDGHEYGEGLIPKLEDLLNRAKSGSYIAPPVRRTLIPKGPNTKELRPLGIPAFEDKVLQRAILMLIEPILETDFLDCSYGFRPKRSPHDCLKDLWKETMDANGGFIIRIDIRKFFDNVDKAKLREMIRQRICDGVLLKLIDKWLKAGVMDGQQLSYSAVGTPQGAVISPRTQWILFRVGRYDVLHIDLLFFSIYRNLFHYKFDDFSAIIKRA
jgi:RNA-directed DNA polymerase